MSYEHERYGSYYGKLVKADVDGHIKFSDIDDTAGLVEELLNEIGVAEIYFDTEDDRYSDTMFFKIDKNTDLKALMVKIVNFHPHEFSEESENHFRMWFD